LLCCLGGQSGSQHSSAGTKVSVNIGGSAGTGKLINYLYVYCRRILPVAALAHKGVDIKISSGVGSNGKAKTEK